MLLDAPRRYCRNLSGFVISKPPCVIFTVCLCCLAIALFWLGYYVNNNEIVDPEAEKDWNDFLTTLSDVQFCIDKMDTKLSHGMSKLDSNTTKSFKQNGFQQISIPLTIGVHVRDDDHYVHGNITHLTTIMDAPFVGSGKIVHAPFVGSGIFKRRMNLTFSLSEVWNTEKKCTERGKKCKLPEGFFHSCVTVLAPSEVLPEWRPETCNSSLFSKMTTMKVLKRKSQRSKCESGAIIYFKHPVDLELKEKLSVDERARANLHLQVTSYFLFILVITSIIYGMLKGKPLKTKKLNFDANGI